MAKRILLTLCSLLALLSLLSTAAEAKEYYRFLQRDFRKCASPLCGGFFVEKVNVLNSTIYVASIVYSDSTVADTVANFTGEYPAATIVFFGSLGPFPALPDGTTFDVKNLNVLTAYLGMPGQKSDVKSLKFYTILADGSSTRAKLLNFPRQAPKSIRRSSVTPVNPTNNLDLDWQLNQILSEGAVVAGTIKTLSGSRTSVIYIKAADVCMYTRVGACVVCAVAKSKQSLTVQKRGNLSADPQPSVTLHICQRVPQVYIKLPVVQGPCPLFKIACNEQKGGQVVYTRSVDLCFNPQCIYDPLFCILSIPTCADGYRLAGWPAPPGGCSAYACDPLFSPVATFFPF